MIKIILGSQVKIRNLIFLMSVFIIVSIGLSLFIQSANEDYYTPEPFDKEETSLVSFRGEINFEWTG